MDEVHSLNGDFHPSGRVGWAKWNRPAGRPDCLSVSGSVGVSVQGLSSIAHPDGTNTKRCARARERRWCWSRGATCHVWAATCRHVKSMQKNSNTATAQTGGGRDPKLSGQKGLGLTWVPWGRTAPGVQKCARRAHFCISAFCPLAPRHFELGSPNLAQGGTLTRAIHPHKNFWTPKIRGSKFWENKIFRFWTPRRSKCAGP